MLILGYSQRPQMKTIFEFLGVLSSLVVFLLLACTLWWLWDPHIPGVHRAWNYILVLALFGELALIKWIMKSGNKNNADKAI
jgi:hypothetical protein